MTGAERLLPVSATDKVLGAMAYEKGALGSYYTPAGSVLINAGSQSATGEKDRSCAERTNVLDAANYHD